MLNRFVQGNKDEHVRLSDVPAEEEDSKSSVEARKRDVGQDLGGSSLDLRAEGNQRQQAIPSEDLEEREKGSQRQHGYRNPWKHLIIAGLVVMVIVFLFLPIYRRVGMLEAQIQKSTEINVATETKRAEVKAEVVKEHPVDKTQESAEVVKGNLVNSAKDSAKAVKEHPVERERESAEAANNNLLKEDSQPKKVQRQRQNWVSDPNSKTFDVPRLVWTYSEDIQRNTFFVRKCLENIARFSKESGFQMIVLNESNYGDFVDKETLLNINTVIWMLKDRMQKEQKSLKESKSNLKEPSSSLKEHFETIKKRLIVFHVLNENGGIFIEKNVFFVESFEWLKEIERNVYVNKGSAKVKARYFGFSDLDHGPTIQKFNKTGVAYEAEKYMVRLPTFEPYFLAAQPRQEFLTEVLVEYVEILANPKLFRQKFDRYGLYLQLLQGKDIYFQIFYTCQLIVLMRKQQDINRMEKNKFGNTFAIDYYGFLTMNDRYFPKKMGFYFENEIHDKFYWSLARYSLTELQTVTGPIRYIVHLTEQNNLELQLLRAREGIKKSFLHPESLLGKFIINNSSEPYIIKEYVREMPRQKKTWDKLPKKIWQYWDNGIKNSNVANKLCYDNLRRAAAKLNFQVIEVNSSNTEQYIGKELNDKINNWIKNAKITTYNPTRSDFVRLALIAKQGGIYVDLSSFSIQTKGIEWIINIAQEPLESISNRYGELPKVLASHWPRFGVNFNQTYDKQANTNRQMVNGYQNHFIVAEPDQQLIWDWLEEYAKFITTPYKETENSIKDIAMFGDHWTIDNIYLAAMESLRMVVAKKNQVIQKKIDQDPHYNGPVSGAQYYGLWSFNSYTVQRFRRHTNFDNTYSGRKSDYNLYLWRYSHQYVEGILGKVQTLTKLYMQNIRDLNAYLTSDFDSNYSDLHPESLVAKYLYLPKLHKLTKKDGKLALDLSP